MQDDDSRPNNTPRDWEEEEQAHYEQEEAARIGEEERVAEERESAVEDMVQWFNSQFEDPANDTPWDGEDKEYVYVFGGPFEAIDVIGDQYADRYSDEWINEAVKHVQRHGHFEWAPKSSGDYYEHPEPDVDEADLTVANAIDKTDAIGILLAKVDRLEQRLEEIAPAYGHNGPPHEIGVPPYDDEDRDKLKELVSIVRGELAKAQPDPSSLHTEAEKAATIGAKILAYAAKTADTAVQESVKTAAKWGTAIGIAQLTGFDLAQFGVELVNLASDIVSFVAKFVMP